MSSFHPNIHKININSYQQELCGHYAAVTSSIKSIRTNIKIA